MNLQEIQNRLSLLTNPDQAAFHQRFFKTGPGQYGEGDLFRPVGWMLREVGKRDLLTEERFLAEHYCQMPRTMLPYAIERFHPEKRMMYLKGDDLKTNLKYLEPNNQEDYQ